MWGLTKPLLSRRCFFMPLTLIVLIFNKNLFKHELWNVPKPKIKTFIEVKMPVMHFEHSSAHVNWGSFASYKGAGERLSKYNLPLCPKLKICDFFDAARNGHRRLDCKTEPAVNHMSLNLSAAETLLRRDPR